MSDAQDVVLDSIDRKILELLAIDGRMTNAALASAVGLTPTPMLARIKKLEQQGVIVGYQAVVDPSKIGRSVLAYVHVTLKNHGVKGHEGFLKIAGDLPAVMECHHLAGEEDFLLKVRVADIAALERFLLSDLSTSKDIARVKTTLVLSTSKSVGGR